MLIVYFVSLLRILTNVKHHLCKQYEKKMWNSFDKTRLIHTKKCKKTDRIEKKNQFHDNITCENYAHYE